MVYDLSACCIPVAEVPIPISDRGGTAASIKCHFSIQANGVARHDRERSTRQFVYLNGLEDGIGTSISIGYYQSDIIESRS